MTERTGPATPPLAGRLPEQEVLVALLDRAADGEAGTILIGGSAGVGKTSLVQAAVAGRDAVVATGGCLPLVAVTVPFMAIRAAMASVEDRADPPTSGLASGDAGAATFERFDRWLDALCAEAPVVLVIEDLHWADQFSLDTLMYVIAGPARRRLAVVLTMRNDELGDDHRLHRWLADTRRLPRFAELTLQPFDRLDTAEQLAGLLSGLPHQTLIEEVYRRSGGNPLLIRLLSTGLAPDARQLPETPPPSLRQAVLRAWFGLTPATRELVGLLAIGGHPLRAAELAAVVGVDVATVRAHLGAAVAAGVLDPARDDVYWFNHPLYAEALEDAVAPDDRRRWHAGFADHLQAGNADEAGVVAAHWFHADALADAYRWSLRAAAWHEAEGSHAERIPMLHRALALRERVDPPESREQLLVRLRHAAADAGAYGDELEAVDALLAGTSPDTRPTDVAELLVRRTQLHLFTGRAFYAREDLREAVRLAAGAPSSREYPLALAELGHAELWHGEEEGIEHARAALPLARAAGDDRALCAALAANAFAALFSGDAPAGLPLGREAFEAGLRARDWWGCTNAVFWEANCLNWASAEPAAILSSKRQELARAGAPHAYLAWLASNQAFTALTIGSWQESAQILRETLASDPGPVADVEARLCSARLAVWQGRQREAEQHLARADELFAARSEFLAFEFDAVRAEVLLGAGDPGGAHAAALAGLGMARALPSMCEWLVPLAARALGDQAESARDAGQDQSAVLAAAADLHSRHPRVVRDVGPVWPEYERQCRALDALYAAELGRVRADPDEGRLWSEAADALAEAALAWETAYACRRGAEALLGRGHDRTAGAALLRRGLDLTEALAAEPLREQLLALARRARVPTSQVVPVEAAATTGPTAITTREREILALLVAGRTYAEIATELVISEKTVSSHVSHLLAKTGTTNRVELAGYAERARPAPGPVATAAGPRRSDAPG